MIKGRKKYAINMVVRCPKCGIQVKGYDLIHYIFGFRRRIFTIKENKDFIIKVSEGTPLRFIKRFRLYPQSYCKECRKNKKKHISINLLEGLTNFQENVVKLLVNEGFSPLGFDIDITNNKFYYFGKQIPIKI